MLRKISSPLIGILTATIFIFSIKFFMFDNGWDWLTRPDHLDDLPLNQMRGYIIYHQARDLDWRTGEQIPKEITNYDRGKERAKAEIEKRTQ